MIRRKIIITLIVIIGIPLLAFFKYFKKWSLLKRVNNMCKKTQKLSSKFRIKSLFIKKKADKIVDINTLREAIRMAIVLCPFQTICTERALTAALIFSFFGLRINLVYGVRFRPYMMHIWIEYEEGSVIFDSPRDQPTFSRLGVIE